MDDLQIIYINVTKKKSSQMQVFYCRAKLRNQIKDRIQVLSFAVVYRINTFKVVICIIVLVNSDLFIINEPDFIEKMICVICAYKGIEIHTNEMCDLYSLLYIARLSQKTC